MTATAELDSPAVKGRSGGPRTPEGKDASRRNALKHGMRARVLLPGDLATAIAERNCQFTDEFQPNTPYEAWLIAQGAEASVRIDRCAELSIAALERQADRALFSWDDDHALRIEELAAKLPRNPSRTVAALRTTRHGAVWLIERWQSLGDALEGPGCWDDSQRRLALNLLGTPKEFRDCSAALPADADLAALKTLVRDQIAALQDRLTNALEPLDDKERALTEIGLPLDTDAPTAWLLRIERECRRTFNWALAEFRKIHRPNELAPARPMLEPEPEPEPGPGPEPEPNRQIVALLNEIATRPEPKPA
ncbi:MAG: hypothetical protein ABI353_15955, partial [Isosphaeraceae bacterium]